MRFIREVDLIPLLSPFSLSFYISREVHEELESRSSRLLSTFAILVTIIALTVYGISFTLSVIFRSRYDDLKKVKS